MRKLLISCLTFLLLCCAVNSYALSAAVQAVVGSTTVAAAGITYVTTFTETSTAGESSTQTVSYSAGNLVVVALGWDGTGTLSTLSDGTNNFTLQTGNVAYGSVNTQLAWCVIGTSQTNATLTAAFSGAAPNDSRIATIVFSGSFPANPVDKYVAASGISDAPQITSGTLSQAAEVVVVVVHADSGTRTFTADTGDGFTEVQDSAGTLAQYKITSATTSLVVDSVINTADYWSSNLGSYKNQ